MATNHDTSLRIPDLSRRPLRLIVERDMTTTPDRLYQAWTEQFDRWFAAPGSVSMHAEVNAPFFFETEYAFEDGQPATRHPHYGRFLRLQPDALVELTWVTGEGGTEGAETVVTVELTPTPAGSHLRLTHAGWPNERSRDNSAAAWPAVLDQLDARIRE